MINKHCGHRRTVEGCADCRIAELEAENERLREAVTALDEVRVKYEGLCDAIYNLSLVDLLEVKGE